MKDSRPQGKAWAQRPLGNAGALAWNVPTIFTYLQVSSSGPPLFLKTSFEMVGAPWVLIIVSRDQRGCECLLSSGTGFPDPLDRVAYCHQKGERNVPDRGLRRRLRQKAGSGAAGVYPQGLSQKGGRPKGSYFTPRQKFGYFCLGALIAAFIPQEKHRHRLC